MTTLDSRETAVSMIVSGSSVAAVGGILTVTKTVAFIAMMAFGLFVLTLGVLAARKHATRERSDESQPTENLTE